MEAPPKAAAPLPSWARYQPEWARTVFLLGVEGGTEEVGRLNGTADVVSARLDQQKLRNRVTVAHGQLLAAVDAAGDEGEARVRQALAPALGLAFRLVIDRAPVLAEIALKGEGEGVEPRLDTYRAPGGKTVEAPYLWSASRGALARRVQHLAGEVSLPKGTLLQLVDDTDPRGGYRTLLFEGKVWLDDSHLVSAERVDTGYGLPAVLLRLSAEGARLLKEVTTSGLGRRLAIFSNGYLLSMPVIMTAVPGGTVQITGRHGPTGDPLFARFAARTALKRIQVLEAAHLPEPAKTEASTQ